MTANREPFREAVAAATILLLIAGMCLAGEAAARGEQDPPFAIICFPGPPASDNRVEHYEAIRRANSNLVLPRSGAEMAIVAFIDPPQGEVIEKILRHSWFVHIPPR